MKTDVYSIVTARILSELENGHLPWVKPWRATAGANMPCNAVTNRPYSGANVVLLWMSAQASGWATPRYLTFKQAKEAGGSVRKGEHGHMVIFVKQLLVKGKDGQRVDEDGNRKVTMLRYYTVFNVAQCDGLPAHITAGYQQAPRHMDDRDPLIEEFVASTGAQIVEGHGEAYYRPSTDQISMPSFESFNSADAFYGVEFHEMVHWTGAKSRLDRLSEANKASNRRGYAFEELIAELGAAFMCAEFGINGEARHAAYIASWITLLKDDPKAFVSAASQAQKAVDFMRGLALADEPEPEAIAA